MPILFVDDSAGVLYSSGPTGLLAVSIANTSDARTLISAGYCQVQMPVCSSPITGVVYTGCDSLGGVIAIDPTTGANTTVLASEQCMVMAMAVNPHTDVLFVACQLAGILAVNGTNVTQLVSGANCAPWIGGLTLDAGSGVVYVGCQLTSTTITLLAIDTDGRVSTFADSVPFPFDGSSWSLAVSSRTGVVFGCTNAGLRAFTPRKGTNASVSTIETPCAQALSVAVDDATGTVYAACEGLGVVAIFLDASGAATQAAVPLTSSLSCAIGSPGIVASPTTGLIFFICQSVASWSVDGVSASSQTPLATSVSTFASSSSTFACRQALTVAVQTHEARVFAVCEYVTSSSSDSTLLVEIDGMRAVPVATLPNSPNSLFSASNGLLYAAGDDQSTDQLLAINGSHVEVLATSAQCASSVANGVEVAIAVDVSRGIVYVSCTGTASVIAIRDGVVIPLINTTLCYASDLALDPVTGILYIPCVSTVAGVSVGGTINGGVISLRLDDSGAIDLRTVIDPSACQANSISLDHANGVLFASCGLLLDLRTNVTTPFNIDDGATCGAVIKLRVDERSGVAYVNGELCLYAMHRVGGAAGGGAMVIQQLIDDPAGSNVADFAVDSALGGIVIATTTGVVAISTTLGCPIGYALTSAGCSPCPIGSMRNFTQLVAGDVTCTACAAGSVAPSEGSTACTRCTPGTFAASPLLACADCNAGSYTATDGAVICSLCPTGRFGLGGSNSSDCSGVCAAGYWCSSGSSSPTQIECGAESVYCPTNSSQPVPVSLGMMTANSSDLTRPSHTMTTQEPCPIGTYCDGSGISRSCPAGSYQNETGQSTCTLCPLGTASSAVGASSCTPCSPGTYSDFTGATTCTLCLHGSASNDTGRTTRCDDCLPGYDQSQNGQTTCDPCGSQKYSPTAGSSSCAYCDYIVIANRTKCSASPCGANTYFDPSTQTCVTCPLGQYSVAGGSCGDCTPGTYTPAAGSGCVSCDGADMTGLKCAAGLASVDKNYWAFRVSDASISSVPIFHTAACPEGFCPGSQLQIATVSNSSSTSQLSEATVVVSSSLDIVYCSWPRLNSPDNSLCGQCAGDYIPWHQGCASCAGVNGALVFGLLILSFAFTGFLLVSSSSKSSVVGGLTVVLLYFEQTAALIITPVVEQLSWIKVFNLSPASISTCWAHWTPLQQMLATLLTPVLLCTEMWIIAALHRSIGRRLRRSNPAEDGTGICGRITSFMRGMTADFNANRYIGGCVSVLLSTFTPVAQTCASLLYCVDVGDERLLFESPTVSCESDEYRRYRVLVIAIILVFIAGFPIASVAVMAGDRRSAEARQDGSAEAQKDSADDDSEESAIQPSPSSATIFWRESLAEFRTRWGPLYVMYSPRAWYWQSLVLMRRAAFVLVSVVLLQSPAHRFMVFALLNFASLLLHQIVHPFVDARTNLYESASYVLLVIISIMLPAYDTPYPVSVQVALFLLVLPPAIFIGALVVLHHWRAVRRQVQSSVASLGASFSFSSAASSARRHIDDQSLHHDHRPALADTHSTLDVPLLEMNPEHERM